MSEEFLDWTESLGLHLLNLPGEVTFYRGTASSVLDLTFVNAAAASELVTEWQVREELATGSDHLPITWDIRFAPSSPPPPPISSFFCFPDDAVLPWTQSFLRHLHLPHTDLTLPGKIDRLMDALTSASEDTAKRRTPHPRASPWFTKEVADSLTAVREARKTLSTLIHPNLLKSPTHPTLATTNSDTHVDPNIDTARQQLRKATRDLHRIVRKSKRDWAMQFTSEIEARDVWRLNSWYKGVRCHHSPVLIRPDNSLAVSVSEKADFLRGSFFPPPPPTLPNKPPPTELSPCDATRDYVDLTTEEVEAALRMCSKSSAPGPSGIPYKVIKWAWIAAEATIFEILQECLREGLHHTRWKRAITIVLPKPNKPSYSTPRAWRPIQLLETLGKLLEKIIASRISFDVGRFNLVPPEQFGGRRSSSCLDAALSLTHDIESAWNHQRVASFLCIDVKGFFDNVNHDRLVRVMWEKGFPIPIVRWVRSFLTDRSTAISLDGSTLPFAPVNIGIPQGSPVSPVLSIIYASEIVEKLLSLTSIPTAPKAYIDDLGLLAISSSLHDNVSTLEKAFRHTVDSLAEIGMTIDPTKLEIQHFSRRPSDSVLPALHVTIDGSPITVTAPKNLRWLGFYLDKRLSFRSHVKIMANRASSVINGLRCLGNTVRGLSQANFRVLSLGAKGDVLSCYMLSTL